MRRGSRLSRRRRRGGEEQATDIKSNNPHLAGGEQPFGWSDAIQFTGHLDKVLQRSSEVYLSFLGRIMEFSASVLLGRNPPTQQ